MALNPIEVQLTSDMMAAFLNLSDMKKERIIGIAIGLGIENDDKAEPVTQSRNRRSRKGKF